jgi:hypothetical protein
MVFQPERKINGVLKMKKLFFRFAQIVVNIYISIAEALAYYIEFFGIVFDPKTWENIKDDEDIE